MSVIIYYLLDVSRLQIRSINDGVGDYKKYKKNDLIKRHLYTEVNDHDAG